MALDCEYNQPSGKTIEIGAAVFDSISGTLIGEFQTFVNPGERISSFITELTGIEDHYVTNAPDINDAFCQLKEFHNKHGCFMNPVVWGSGVTNDSHHIYIESERKDPNFMGYRVIDVKTIYQSIQIYKNGRPRGSLEKAMKSLGLVFEGEKHRALVDATNTFKLWHHIMRKLISVN